MKKKILFGLILYFITGIVPAQENPLWLRYPAVSPDGSSIVFNFKGNIYQVDVNGGKAIPITTNPGYDFNPVWSPNGKRIAFASNRHGNFDIFVISAEGGKPKRLTYFSGNEVPSSFSPDGKFVVFSATIQDLNTAIMFPSGVLSELYKVPVNGGRTEQIISTPALNATFSKDGNTIFYEDRKGYENIWRKHHTSSIARDIWKYDKTLKNLAEI